MGAMSHATSESSRGDTRPRSIVVPALLAVALFAAGVAVLVWSMSSAGTGGALEHEETSAFSRIQITMTSREVCRTRSSTPSQAACPS